MRFLSGEVAIDGVKTDFVDTWLARERGTGNINVVGVAGSLLDSAG